MRGQDDELAATVPIRGGRVSSVSTFVTGASRPPAPPRYELGRRLGSGGMGVVYEARDVVLDRVVALKFLRSDLTKSDAACARLLREAQALARLKHANVVTLFEVGRVGPDIYLAMELVAGGTLHEWMKAPRGWREVVDVFLAFGRGLAEAHRLGLVHRDIKPANVLIDLDGTPKIGDFGLVTDSGVDSPPATPGGEMILLMCAETTTGSVVGTPAYMAPEQLGGRVDARADQYAFCASLHEVLTGRVPGEDERVREVPRRLRGLVARGLEPRPEDRFASMEALLGSLGRARRRRARPVLAVIACAAIAGLGVWGGAHGRAAAGDPCPAPSTAQVWSHARRAALEAHASAIDPARGAARAATVAGRAESYLDGWRAMRVEACRATRVRGAQSDTALDLRVRCLERRLRELDLALAMVERAPDIGGLDAAAEALAAPIPLDGCADTAALAAAAPPPERPAERAAAERLERELELIAARERARAFDGLAARARRAVDDARALGHAPTLAAALAGAAEVELGLGDDAAAEPILRELTQVAAGAHDDRDEAYGWTRLFGVLADRGAQGEARSLVPAAAAAVLRAGAPVELRADLLFERGAAEHFTANARDGLAEIEEARALLEQAGADQPGSPLASRHAGVVLEAGVLAYEAGDRDAGYAGIRRAIELFREIHGPDSPDEAFAWHDLGESYRRAGRLDDALDAYQRAIEIRSARAAGSASLATSLGGAAETLAAMARWDDARAIYEQAIALDRRLYAAGDAAIDLDLSGLAAVLAHTGHVEEAAQILDEIVPRLERTAAGTPNLGAVLTTRASVSRLLGRCAAARADDARARAIFDAAGNPGDAPRDDTGGRCAIAERARSGRPGSGHR